MIEFGYKILGFLVTLGVLVVFHELGHYVVARWCGVKVLRFSVGFGRIVASRRFGRDGTEWALSAIPLGGYVKMADEREGDLPEEDRARAFNRQSVYKRIAIAAAGPIANLLLAVVLFAGTYMVGIPGQRAILADPAPGTPAAAAGVRNGDLVVAIDGEPVKSWQDLRWRMTKAQGRESVTLAIEPAGPHAGDPPVTRSLAIGGLQSGDWEGNALGVLGLRADLGPPLIAELVAGKPGERAGLKSGDRIVAIDDMPVRRRRTSRRSPTRSRVRRSCSASSAAARRRTCASRPRRSSRAAASSASPVSGSRSIPASAERLGITVRYGPLDALWQGTRKTWELSVFTLSMLGRIFIGEASLKNISGPITMADFAGQSAQAGTLVFVGYLALISISLGVLNLLPVPLLDGGHLLYYFAEIFRGSPYPTVRSRSASASAWRCSPC